MFDYENNPAGYRLCQDEAAKIGGIELLLQQAISGKDDALRSQSLEAIARMSFGNPATVELAAGAAETLQAICTALQSGAMPEKLSALQLAQTVAASSSPNAVAMVPQLVPEAAALLSENFGFDQLSRGALDFLVSSSFTHPHAVVGALGWQQIIDLLSEDRRPAWLHAGPLETFICGLLATNCLEAASGEADASHEIVAFLQEGTFLHCFLECLDAAVHRCAWPADSACFHSPNRLAEAASVLAEKGFSRTLVPAVTSLVQIVETAEENTQTSALLALRKLCSDVGCLEGLLAQEEFRKGTMELLHKSGEQAATDLLSYMEFVETAFRIAQAAKDAQAQDNLHAPTVLQLAEMFQRHAPLDGKIDATLLVQLCSEVPLAPSEKVIACLTSSSDVELSLQSFMERVYGTPTILGWWPSLMQEAAALFDSAEAVPRLPSLSQAVAVFEESTGGRSSLAIQTLHDVALPALGIPTEGTAVEVKFAELHGSVPLSFKAFAKWLVELCINMAEEDAEALAETEAA